MYRLVVKHNYTKSVFQGKKIELSAFVDRCLHIVDDYYIPFFNYVLNELNAKEACAALGLCKANTAFFQVVQCLFNISKNISCETYNLLLKVEESIPVSINLPTDASHQVKSVIAPPEPRSNAIDGGSKFSYFATGGS